MLSISALCAVACSRAPSEPSSAEARGSAGSADAGVGTTTGAASAPTASALDAGAVLQHGGADPLGGRFGLAEATRGLKGKGPLVATLDTSNGLLSCKLYDDKAPNTVANFVGLARGLRPWRTPQGDWVRKPAYDGTTFHRVVKGFMIQGGDPEGTGMGEPGYTIKDEIWPDAKHDRAGLLCMANRGHDTSGQQFFVTDGAASYLDGAYTIFGECAPEQTVHDIASVATNKEKPITPVVIKNVVIARK